MANTKNNLYSVGPGSIGPGTSVVRSVLSPQRESGVITRMYQDENGISVSSLGSLYGLSESVFPGTAITLDYTRIKQLSDTLALVVSYYGQSSSASGFRRVMTRSPSGYRQFPVWPRKNLNDYAKVEGHYVNGVLVPQKMLTVPTVSIRWSSVVFMDSRPNDNQSLIGKVNSNSYNIDGYSHAAYTLKFGGTSIAHDKYGGYDRWTLSHSVTYDPLYRWRKDYVEQTSKKGVRPLTFSRPNNDGIPDYDDEANFPNLP